MRKVQSRTSGADARQVEAWPDIRSAVGRPTGTLVVTPSYPAQKRGAKLGRPSGAGFEANRKAT
jgi:hypothetical protein